MSDELDQAVLKFIKTQKKELDLSFETFGRLVGNQPISDITFPEPSAAKLWAKGLKKYGNEFAEREYALKLKSKQNKKKE